MEDFLSQQCINFMKFVDDCTVFCTANRGMKYEPLPAPEGCVEYFSADYGNTVLHYHASQEANYMDRIKEQAKNQLLTHEGLQEYMSVGIAECFKENAIMEGILKFCSFYLDMALFCHRYNKANLINESLVCSVSLVFEEYVRPLFIEADPEFIGTLWDDIKRVGINLTVTETAKTFFYVR